MVCGSELGDSVWISGEGLGLGGMEELPRGMENLLILSQEVCHFFG